MSHDEYVIFTPNNVINHPSPSPSSPPSRTYPSFPAREDCWTEEATHTLVQAWGSHYLELNRGNLRQKHWQQVADAVNSLHAHTKKQYRTDIQCKNRIDTLKKRYKIEKTQTIQSNGRYSSTWPFFNALDHLIADSFLKTNLSISPSPSAAPAIPMWKYSPALPPPPSAVPVGLRSKRPVSEEALSRRNFSAMAAAAARAADEDDDDDEEEDEVSDTGGMGRRGCRRESKDDLSVAEGYTRLAEAIGRFAEVYQRVEEAKQRQVVELEKQRMKFTRELEIERMKLFMEWQIHPEKVKRAKMNSPDDGYA